MLSLYGKLEENENKEFCIDGVPVADALVHFVGEEISLSISRTEDCILMESTLEETGEKANG